MSEYTLQEVYDTLDCSLARSTVDHFKQAIAAAIAREAALDELCQKRFDEIAELRAESQRRLEQSIVLGNRCEELRAENENLIQLVSDLKQEQTAFEEIWNAKVEKAEQCIAELEAGNQQWEKTYSDAEYVTAEQKKRIAELEAIANANAAVAVQVSEAAGAQGVPDGHVLVALNAVTDAAARKGTEVLRLARQTGFGDETTAMMIFVDMLPLAAVPVAENSAKEVSR